MEQTKNKTGDMNAAVKKGSRELLVAALLVLVMVLLTSIAGNRAMHDGSYSGAGIDAIRWCEENAGEIFRAFDGTVSLEI